VRRWGICGAHERIKSSLLDVRDQHRSEKRTKYRRNSHCVIDLNASNINLLIRGGGGSHLRTRLCYQIPHYQGKLQGISRNSAFSDNFSVSLAAEFNGLQPNSLRNGTGNVS
jgi:hypothetical protein